MCYVIYQNFKNTFIKLTYISWSHFTIRWSFKWFKRVNRYLILPLFSLHKQNFYSKYSINIVNILMNFFVLGSYLEALSSGASPGSGLRNHPCQGWGNHIEFESLSVLVQLPARRTPYLCAISTALYYSYLMIILKGWQWWLIFSFLWASQKSEVLPDLEDEINFSIFILYERTKNLISFRGLMKRDLKDELQVSSLKGWC